MGLAVNTNEVAPEGRNIIDIVSNVPPLRGWCVNHRSLPTAHAVGYISSAALRL